MLFQKGKNGNESDKVSRSPLKCNQDQMDQRGKRRTSPYPRKPSKSRRILTLEETCITNKLADLNKWKYSIRDIRWVDGEYVCPECGKLIQRIMVRMDVHDVFLLF